MRQKNTKIQNNYNLITWITMHIAHQIQQNMYGRIWGKVTRDLQREKMGRFMIVKGRVIGNVEITDLCKQIAYNSVVTFSELEINKSKDLHNAIRHGWVEIIEDRGALARALVTPSQVQQPLIDESRILEMAQEIAKTTAKEMLKNNATMQDTIRELAKEMAREMVKELNIPKLKEEEVEQKVEQQIEDVLIEDQKPKNIFIDVESNVKVNADVGQIKEEKVNLSDSLEKMKRFRRKEGTV